MLVPLERPLEHRHAALAANFRSIKVTARILHVGTESSFFISGAGRVPALASEMGE